MRTSWILFGVFVFLFWYLWSYLVPLHPVAAFTGWACITVALSYWLSRFVWKQAFVTTVRGDGKAVLITGCSTGFGHGLAKRLAHNGFLVFAGFRNRNCDGAEELKTLPNMKILQMDVTKQEQVDKALETVKQQLENRVLWCVVANAGIASYGPIELISMETVFNVFDVNVFGALRVIKKFLPLLKESRGRVVAVASPLGHFTLPMTGPYSMSKHAVVAMLNAFRRDNPNIGVDFIAIDPAVYRTPLLKKNSNQMELLIAELEQKSPEESANYHQDGLKEYMKTTIENFEMAVRESPEEAIDMLENAVRETYPKTAYSSPAGLDAPFTVIFTHAPTELADHVMRLVGRIPPLLKRLKIKQ